MVVDYAGTVHGEPIAGGEGRDQLVELGAGALVEGLEEALVGAGAGDERTAEVMFPADYQNASLAGQPASFNLTVKEVRHKELPELDDDFAADAGFDNVAEMREDIARRLGEAQAEQIEQEFRDAAVDAAAAHATIDVPADLVAARSQEMWERAIHALSHRGVSKEAYLRVTGRNEEEVIAEGAPEAERSLRREAVLAAVIEAEGIAPTDEDVLEAIGELAAQERTTPDKLFAGLRKAGRLEDMRQEIAARRAIDLLAASAVAIPAERAAAREKLWTPGTPGQPAAGKTAEEPAPRLWTPGS